MENELAKTEYLFRQAGLSEGMTVLDFGCGRGEVSFLASRLVGPSGAVVGIDIDAGIVDVARARIAEIGASNVRFERAPASDLPEFGKFDAIVGRRVLMYQRDVAAELRELARAAKPGALVVFQELDNSVTPASSRQLPLHRQVHAWIWQTVAHEGANTHMGFELTAAFLRAGLTHVQARADLVLQTESERSPLGNIIRWILPRIEAAGVATAAEIDVETLDERLVAELTQEPGTVHASELLFGVWGRTASISE